MDKPFGFRGTLIPKSAFNELEENLVFGSISVSIKNGVFEVGYNNETDKKTALRIANALVASWSKRNHIKIEVEFNQSWQVKSDGHKSISLDLHDEIKVTDRIITNSVIVKAMAYIIKPRSDSYSFANDKEMAEKAKTDETLSLALQYFYEGVVDQKVPQVGIHKAIEQIIKHLPGKNENERRNKLAEMAGCDRPYIDDLMTSIQFERHSKEWVETNKIKKLIDDQECVTRAGKLIDAYAESFTMPI